MPPSALCTKYMIKQLGKTFVQDKFLGPVEADVYEIHFTLTDPSLINSHAEEGTRYDTIATWGRSVTEQKRKIARSKLWVKSEFGKLLDQYGAYFESIYVEVTQKVNAMILDRGNWTFEQFKIYALDHKDSGTGISRLNYAVLLKDEEKLKRYWSDVTFILKAFLKRTLNDNWMSKHLKKAINPRFTYPALRSRSGDVLVELVAISNFHFVVKVTKYRDRGAGGILALSALNYPCWNMPLYKEIDHVYIDVFERETHNKAIVPSIEGISSFVKFLADKSTMTTFDCAAQEVQDGMYLRPIFKVDHRLGDKICGIEKLSGDPRTGPENNLTLAIQALALQDLGLEKHLTWYFYSDNVSIAKDVRFIIEPLDLFFGLSERWLGVNKEKGKIGGLRITADQKDKSKPVGRHTNFQFEYTTMGKMRLLQSAFVNNLLEPYGYSFTEGLDDIDQQNLEIYHRGEPIWHRIENDSIELPTKFIDRLMDSGEQWLAKIDLPNLGVKDRLRVKAW